MARLIDADALIKSIESDRNCSDMPSQWIDGVNYAIDLIELYEPTIDAVSVVHGEWICHEGKWIDFDYYPTKYECSQCHHYVDVASDKNFCPNCGAKMKGADDE